MAVMQINLCITTQKCVLHREPQYLWTSKPNNFKKFLCQKIKELEDKVDNLKIFFATVKKETKEVMAPETQYGPDSQPSLFPF